MDEIYESEGPRRYLDRFLAEIRPYGGARSDRIKVDTHEPWVSSAAPEEEYVYTSPFFVRMESSRAPATMRLLFSVGRSPRTWCMPSAFSPTEAVARVYRQWSEPGPSGRVPRTWIVGLNLADHQSPDDWAGDIYYGKDSHWWRPESDPRPLPPP